MILPRRPPPLLRPPRSNRRGHICRPRRDQAEQISHHGAKYDNIVTAAEAAEPAEAGEIIEAAEGHERPENLSDIKVISK